jgi:hypothetical protein
MLIEKDDNVLCLAYNGVLADKAPTDRRTAEYGCKDKCMGALIAPEFFSIKKKTDYEIQ